MGDQLSKQVAMFARVCRCIMCVVFLWGAWKTIYALSGSHMVNGIVENRLQPASHFSHHFFAFSKRYSMYVIALNFHNTNKHSLIQYNPISVNRTVYSILNVLVTVLSNQLQSIHIYYPIDIFNLLNNTRLAY